MEMLSETGLGLMEIPKEPGVPGQPFSVGLTMIFPVMFPDDRFSGPVYGAIFPEPEADKPMAVLVLVQIKLAPAGMLENACGFTESKGQTVRLEMGLTAGVGLMPMLNTLAGEVQEFRVAVTVIFPVISAPVELTGALYELIFPVPVAASPMPVLLLVQLKVLPDGVLENGAGAMVLAGQTRILEMVSTCGVGLTVTGKVITGPIHPFRVAVTEI